MSVMNHNQPIEIAVLGAGSRSRCLVRALLDRAQGRVRIAALYDPDIAVCQGALDYWKVPHSVIKTSYQAATEFPGIGWVMVISPNAFHKEHVIHAFSCGKHVFAEKPLATNLDDCQAIYDAHQQSSRLFATGFVLRYAPLYQEAKRILDSGVLGSILSIDANENIAPAHGGYIMRNWRRHTALAGPHILEKCCHDLDLLNWFCNDVPEKVAAFGDCDFFVPRNEPLLNKLGRATFTSWYDPHAVDSPFTSDKDLMDTQVGILRYRNGIKVMFQATMSNAIPERRMYFSCSEGSMRLDLCTGQLEYRRIGDPEMTVFNAPEGEHGGGDRIIMEELADTMLNGTPPRCSGDAGLESAVTALALDEAARTGKIVNLTPIWKRLER